MTVPNDPGATVPDASGLDELASALLDGEATAAEAGRAGEDAVAARVAEFRAVAQLIGQPVPPPGELARERAIRAALAAAGTAAARSPATRRFPTWLPAAAALVLVAGFLGLFLAVDRGEGGDDVAAGDAASEETLAAPMGEAESAPAEGGAGGSAGSGTGTVDLGGFEDVEALEAALRTLPAAMRASTEDQSSTATAGEGSDELGAACPLGPDADGTVLTIAGAVLAGEPVVVYVLQGGDGTVTYVVYGVPDCRQVTAGEV